MKSDDIFDNEELEMDRIKKFIAMTPERKMECLEEMNKFLNALMPLKSKKIAEKLREEGY